MPTLSMFYGIIIRMFFYDNKEHKLAHIHAEYQNYTAVIAIPEGNIIAGSLPNSQTKMVLAWIEIHKDELMANWKLAVEGNSVFKIDPLK